jgi:hypothetical protein
MYINDASRDDPEITIGHHGDTTNFRFTVHLLTVTLPQLATTPHDCPVHPHPRAPTRMFAANPQRFAPRVAITLTAG